MLFYKCRFFEDVDLLGLDVAQASVVWDLISKFNDLQSRAKNANHESMIELKELELALYHVLNRAYPGGDRRERAMASNVGKIYHELRYRLHKYFDLIPTPNDESQIQDASNEEFSKFVVTLLADGKSKAELSKKIGLHKSQLSRPLSKKTLSQILEHSPFTLGLVSGCEPIDQLDESVSYIFDRAQLLSTRELHCCAIGSKIGRMMHADKSLLFDNAFNQLKSVREQVANSMIEITEIDLKNSVSLTAFESLCRQVVYAISDPDSYLFRKEFIGGLSRPLSDSDRSRTTSLYNQSETLGDWLDDFTCSKLLPRSLPASASYNVLNSSITHHESAWSPIEKYLRGFVDSDCDETSKLMAKVHWKEAWAELVERIGNKKEWADESLLISDSKYPQRRATASNDQQTDLVLRQHAMLTRGLLELQMLTAYKFHVNSASTEKDREERVARIVEGMQLQLDQMKKHVNAQETYQLADFVRADMMFHLVSSAILQKHGRGFLPANTSEMEKYLSLSLLGRDKLRFKTQIGRTQIVTEHQTILEATQKYLSAKSLGDRNQGESSSSEEKNNHLLSANDVALALGKHLFQAIHDEASDSKIEKGYGSNIDQLQEVALMFELMLSQGLRFEPIKLWDKGEIDGLIYFSDCFPPKELVLCSSKSSEEEKLATQAQQIRFILALDKAYNRSGLDTPEFDPGLRTLMAIFVSRKEFIDRLVSVDLFSKKDLKKRLNEAYIGMDGEFDCFQFVDRFKEQIKQLFEKIRNPDCRHKFCEEFGQYDHKNCDELGKQIVAFFDSNRDSKDRIEKLLNCIRVFELPQDVQKQFIAEIGGTVAWHLNAKKLIYTYRQDLNQGASRVIDTRGNRNAELFDLIFSMIEKAGGQDVKELLSIVNTDESDSLEGVAMYQNIEDFIKKWKPANVGESASKANKPLPYNQYPKDWKAIALSVLLMILPSFENNEQNVLGVFRDTLILNQTIQEMTVENDSASDSRVPA
jgi:hypothetical protein